MDRMERYRAEPDAGPARRGGRRVGVPHPVVLVVDDNPDLRNLVAIMLEHAGFSVRRADDGRTAVAAVREIRPDVVLMDLTMPDMDGCQAASVIHDEAGPATRIIAVTARQASRRELEPHGFRGLLRKPVAMSTLLTAVRASIGNGDGWIE